VLKIAIKASAYCGGLILKQTDMKTTMLWCSAHQPTQEQINELEEKGRLILLKSTKDDGGYLTVQTIDRRLKNSSLISEMLESLMLYYCTIGRKPIVLIHGRIIHPRGDE
jgi:hypothetical protein